MKSVVCTKLGDPKLLEIKEVDIPNPLTTKSLSR